MTRHGDAVEATIVQLNLFIEQIVMNAHVIADDKLGRVSDQYHDWSMNTIRLIAAVTLPLALAIASPSALATDGKDYAGAQCQPQNKDAPYLIAGTGAMINPGDTNACGAMSSRKR
jgi:hypothetical protein